MEGAGVEEVGVDRVRLAERVRFENEVVGALEDERDPALAGLDDAALERDLRCAASEVAAATCRWLTLLAEAVRRGLWAQQGARSPAQWLSWLVSMAPSTAREQVRVALRLRQFPDTYARFTEGQLSYSQVRAITRLDEPKLERLLLQFSQVATGAQLERIVRGFDKADRTTWAPEESDPHDRRDCSWVEDGEELVIALRVPKAEGMAAVAKLDKVASTVRRDTGRAAKRWEEGGGDPDQAPEVPSVGQARADVALTALEAVAAAGASPGDQVHTLVLHAHADDLAVPSTTDDRPAGASAEAPELSDHTATAGGHKVPVEVDGSAGRIGRRRCAGISVEVLRRLACGSRYQLVGHDEQGLAGISGTTQAIPPRLRRLLWARDGGCRFPGCTAVYGIEAHHIVHWANGGPTRLGNLVLLCRHHHRWVHHRNWTIDQDGTGRFRFAPPDAASLPTAVALPGASAEAAAASAAHRDPAALRSGWDGVRPDFNACIEAIEQELRRLQPPRDHAEAA